MWPCQRSSYSLAAPRRLGSAYIWDRELPSSITMICWTQPRASKQHTLVSWVAFTSTLGFSTYLQRLRSSTCRGISTKDRRMAATGQSRRPSPSCSTPAEPTGGTLRRRRSRRRTVAVPAERTYVPNMSRPALMTADELLSVRIPERRIELVKGVLVVREPAGGRHGRVTTE